MQMKSRRRFVPTVLLAAAVQMAILGAQAKPDNTATNKGDGEQGCGHGRSAEEQSDGS